MQFSSVRCAAYSIGVFIILITYLSSFYYRCSYIGPKGLPLVGSLFDVMRNSSKAGDENYFHQLLLKYGPVVKVTILGELQFHKVCTFGQGVCSCLRYQG